MKTTAKLSFMMFVEWFIWGAWFVPLWLWLSKSGFSAGEIGWSYACTAIAAILSPILVGSITDRFFSAQKVLAVLMFAGGADDLWRLRNCKTLRVVMLSCLTGGLAAGSSSNWIWRMSEDLPAPHGAWMLTLMGGLLGLLAWRGRAARRG